jgi:chemotaxis protein CheD
MTGKPSANRDDGARDAQWRKVEAGEVVVSRAAADVLTTSAPVGSCVAVCLWDPTSGVGGLLHFLWPDSKLDPARAEHAPACFADTGVQLLFEHAGLMGADKGRCKVRLVGGAEIPDGDQAGRLAKRNLLAVRSVLWRRGVFVDGEEVGGTKARRATLTVSNGELLVGLHE